MVEKSARVERERQVPLFDPPKASELPPLKLLDDPPAREPLYSAEALEALSRLVEMKLKDFGIDAEVVAVQPGPVVTRFELRPAPGVKASQITALSKDLARALSVLSVRVVEVIPGQERHGTRDRQREARDRHPRGDHPLARLRRDALARSRSRSARTSAASRWWRTWRACRTC